VEAFSSFLVQFNKALKVNKKKLAIQIYIEIKFVSVTFLVEKKNITCSRSDRALSLSKPIYRL